MAETARHPARARRDPEAEEDNRAMRLLRLAEDVVYYVMAIVLLAAAVAVLVFAVESFFTVLDETESAMLEVLDALLLVFIFVELLYAVRVTLARHEIAAEPFLLIGIIASIKEIVVVSVEAAGAVGDGALFADRLALIGVLGLVVLALTLSILMLRRSQTYPSEKADDPEDVDPDAALRRGDAEDQDASASAR
jgi:uncharacterized membrane protein (DUF373 family)